MGSISNCALLLIKMQSDRGLYKVKTFSLSHILQIGSSELLWWLHDVIRCPDLHLSILLCSKPPHKIAAAPPAIASESRQEERREGRGRKRHLPAESVPLENFPRRPT